MSDFHALSGAFAIDSLDDIERARFQRHLETCETCADEVRTFQETAALFGELASTPPPASLRDKVLADIATVRPLPPLIPAVADAPSARRRPRILALVAAAAAVIGLGTTAAVVQPWADDSSQVQLSAADRVLAAPDAQRVPNAFGGQATVVRSESLNQAVILPSAMPAAPAGKVYALWLQHDNVMVPAGVMPNTGDAPVVFEGDPATATRAAVSVEDADFTPESPSDRVVALFDFGTA